ncbi:hypothetical protein E1750_03965 [Flavobacterium nackdongense]|uniref:Uncharacterized protein n=1 Tax=Flavobacterium nackdongense TaxID=2547394 RepID=A0A4P6YB52_9FLAO|nr:hypothetical protein E1750_03965 [Flavobacterium nackdongense]
MDCVLWIIYDYENKWYSTRKYFNLECNKTRFATESRLQNLTNSVKEIHFTSGTSIFLMESRVISIDLFSWFFV